MLRPICISALFAANAVASEPVAEFAGLWSEFIGFCGAALAAPHSVGGDARPRNGYSMFNAARNSENTDWTVEHYNENAQTSLSLHLLHKREGFELFCDAHQYKDSQIDPVSATQQIRGMVEAGGMSVTGGAYIFLEGHDQTFAAEHSAAQPHSLVVEGAFPGYNSAVHVNVDRNGFAISIYTSLPGAHS
ncbi:hypothetical protein [Microbulbifer sp. S227A]|uniref:hypothetical protein n=1 Tax=Microbulbifer sp. S227A TaxID=3415131 RepID=UPI003C7D5F58